MKVKKIVLYKSFTGTSNPKYRVPLLVHVYVHLYISYLVICHN